VAWANGVKYGFAAFAAIVINILFGVHLSFSTGNSMICSAMAARAWERLNLIPDCNPMVVMPSDLARYFGAVPPVA
jgi:hypothetical protein